MRWSTSWWGPVMRAGGRGQKHMQSGSRISKKNHSVLVLRSGQQQHAWHASGARAEHAHTKRCWACTPRVQVTSCMDDPGLEQVAGAFSKTESIVGSSTSAEEAPTADVEDEMLIRFCEAENGHSEADILHPRVTRLWKFFFRQQILPGRNVGPVLVTVH